MKRITKSITRTLALADTGSVSYFTKIIDRVNDQGQALFTVEACDSAADT